MGGRSPTLAVSNHLASTKAYLDLSTPLTAGQSYVLPNVKHLMRGVCGDKTGRGVITPQG